MKNSKRIIRLLKMKKVDIILEPLKEGLWGMCDVTDGEIFIMKSLSTRNKMTTLIHECLHFIYPKKSEKWVLANEYEIFHSLTPQEYTFFFNYVRRLECGFLG